MSQTSEALFARALRVIPGGVNSPVRAFQAVGGTPRFIDHARGACLFDVDGKRYIDYVGSWGPMLCGHNHPTILAAVQRACERGLSFGAPVAAEVEMAERISRLVPSMELVRMTNSGTEATMSAIRLARGFSGRDGIIKFEGCYHGHGDSFLVKAGSGALTLGEPTSPGVPAALAALTTNLPYNDLDAVSDYLRRNGTEVACIIVEPVAGNMNCVPPLPGFLSGLLALCEQHGALLIFDEVMTGFRLGPGGAQAHYAITPHLTTLGKVIGGGMPVGAFGGRADIMAKISPSGPVYQAGTLSGNPIAMAAGLASLELLGSDDFFPPLFAATERLAKGLVAAAQAAGLALTENHVGAMFGIFFSDAPSVRSFQQVQACDSEHFRRFFHAMLSRGVYLAPSPYEAGFVSAAHDEAIIEETLYIAAEAFAAVATSPT